MGNSQPKLKLTYFGLRGRGEASRLLLAYAGAEYEDHRITFEQWPELKPSECKNYLVIFSFRKKIFIWLPEILLLVVILVCCITANLSIYLSLVLIINDQLPIVPNVVCLVLSTAELALGKSGAVATADSEQSDSF